MPNQDLIQKYPPLSTQSMVATVSGQWITQGLKIHGKQKGNIWKKWLQKLVTQNKLKVFAVLEQ